MPSPRDQAMKYNPPQGGVGTYCAVCGTPDCVCKDYKEWGADATNAGSKHANDAFPGRVSEEGNPLSGKE